MMRKWLLCAAMCFCLEGFAQKAPVARYEEIPAEVYQLVLDHTALFPYMIYESAEGTYRGQVSPEVQFYGYGNFKSGVYEQTGLYRKGKFIYGITTNAEYAIVGSNDHYAAYNLKSGKLEYIYRNREKMLIDGADLEEYQFMALNYANGDRYVGELMNGQRHGYGIYYYKNGRVWFGQYRQGVRQGFGALFLPENQLKIGEWNGEEEVRVIGLKTFKARR